MGEPFPAPCGNRAILERFRREHQEQAAQWSSDSDVSESELDNVICDLRSLNDQLAERAAARASAGPETASTRRRMACALHVVLAIGTSGSMKRPDVGDGQRRLDAVFVACREFIAEQERQALDAGDVFSMVSFSSQARTWFTRRSAKSALAGLDDAAKEVRARGETRFEQAFKELYWLLPEADEEQPREDVRVLFLSDGRPHETIKSLPLLKKHLLDTPRGCHAKQIVVYTVGFGSEENDFAAFLKPLSDETGGTFQVSTLDAIALQHIFTSVVSSITTSLTSGAGARKCTDTLKAPFDASVRGEECSRTCKISIAKTTRQRRWKGCEAQFELAEKCELATAFVQNLPFGHGGMRLVYHMKDSYNKDQKMVAKRLQQVQHAAEEQMLPFCRNFALAVRYRDIFRNKLNKAGEPCELFFVPCYLYKYNHRGSDAYFVGEQFLEGEFVKFNGNNGHVNLRHLQTEPMQAFSHFSFVQSRGKHMVLDLQGVFDNGGFILTDPQVLSRAQSSDRTYGPGDLGVVGMKEFFCTHDCGPTCELLHLRSQQQKLLRDLELEHRRCKVCLDAPSKTMLEPCGHSVVCEECALKLLERSGKCPVCRSDIEGHARGVFSATFVPPGRRKGRSGAPSASTGAAEASNTMDTRIQACLEARLRLERHLASLGRRRNE